MVKLEIPKDGISYLLQELRDNFDIDTLQKGWDDYRRGAVISMKVVDGSVLNATVRGDRIHNVSLDMDFFAISRCSCATQGYCEHMAAAFFFAYQMNGGRPELFLKECRQAHAERAALLEHAARKKAEERAKAERLKHMRAEAPQAGHTAQEWHSYFEKKFGKYLKRPQSDINTFYGAVTDALYPHADGWDPTLQKIYKIHVLLFVAKQAELAFQNPSRSFRSYFYDLGYARTVSQCSGDIIRLLNGIDREKARLTHPAPLEGMIEFLATHAFPKDKTPVDWLYLYRYLWGNLLYRKEWADREKARLNRELRQQDLHPKSRDFMISALAHFDFLEGNDEGAIARLDGLLYAKEPGNFFPYLHTHLVNKRWDRLLLWMRWMVPLVKKCAPDEFDAYCRYWLEAANQRTLDEGWSDIMTELLPGSYNFYSEYLLAKNNCRLWADLHLHLGISPLDLDADDLRKVEKADLHFLLPLYHQAVERYILRKNREAYRLAVQALQKLQQLYKRLKQPHRWDRYMEQVTRQYSRLRAFHEELTKGKLIS